MNLCWSCQMSEYHNYKDNHGIRCPRCGQKEKDDPKNIRVVKTEEPKAPARRAARSRS